MKRRPGVERRRRRLAVGRIVSGQSDEKYATYNYVKAISQPKVQETLGEDEKYNNTTAQEAGFYFEAKFIQYLNEELKKIDQDITYSEPLNDNQKRATKNFENGIVASKEIQEKTAQLAEQVRRGARALAIQTARDIKKTIQSSENKDIVISNIASSGDVAERVSGDIKVKIGEKELLIEMKWQSSSSANTRLFSQTGDQKLFQGQFGEFASSYQDSKYWQGNYQEGYWTSALAKEVLPEFLKQYQVPGGQELLSYLASKSFGTIPKSKEKGTVKLIAHANYTGFTLTNMEDVGKALLGAKFDTNPKMRYSSEAVLFSVNGQEVATFGIDKYRNSKSVSKEQESKKKQSNKAYKAPDKNAFSFALYIVQKLVSEFATQ